MRRSPLLLCLVFCLSTALPLLARPNVVFILADDLGYGEVGFNGQKKIQTPHLDRLAREGMTLSRHYAGCPVCAPSRAVLMTGRNPGHAPVRDNRDVGQGEQTPLPADTHTLAKLFQTAAYSTALFGKWGLGSIDSTGSPLQQGFDSFLGLTSQWVAHSHYPPFLWKNTERLPLQNGKNGIPGHGAFPGDQDPDAPEAYAAFRGTDFSSDHFIAGAEGFIAASAQRATPFFLYYASPLPHVALQLPEKDRHPYRDAFHEDAPYAPRNPSAYVPNRTPRATYAGMITRLDAEVGRILNALERAGVAKNTLLVFTSDNGPTHNVGGVDTAFFNSAAGLRGLKGSLHEGGIRVPTVVHWPGVIPAGTTSPILSGFEDWMPTFAQIAQHPLHAPHDGESILPALLGKSQTRTQALYREFSGYGHQQALWKGKWKAIRTNLLPALRKGEPLLTQLYDLEADPEEKNDRSAEFADLLREMESSMQNSRVPHPGFPLAGVDDLR